MPRQRLDVPLVWPEAARFVWREAFLEALATVPVRRVRGHDITVLQALHEQCGACYLHAFDALFDELEKSDVSLRDVKRVWAWCCQELAGAELTFFLEDAGAELALGPPALGKSFVDRFRCAADVRAAVDAVEVFLGEMNLAKPPWQPRPWWLLQVALATLLPGTEKGKWAWWREDFQTQAVKLLHPPLPGRLIEHVGDGRPLPGNYAIGKCVTTLEPSGKVLGTSSLEWEPATGHHEVQRTPGEREAFYARRVAAWERDASKAERDLIRTGRLALDPRPNLDPRHFRWTVLARCAEKSFPAIADEEGVTDETARKAVRKVEEHVGFER